MEIVTDPFTGKATHARVCANCEKEKGETAFLHAYLKRMDIPASHGICPSCFNKEMDKLKLG